MKKLLVIVLLSAHFLSCNEMVSEYTENPVLGVWNNYDSATGSLMMTRVFSPDFKSYFSYSEGKPQNRLNEQSYYIEDNKIILDRYTQTFKMQADTLWITNQKQDQTTKYIRVKETLR